MSETTDLADLPLAGVRETDVLFVEKNDGTCSRCREPISPEEQPILAWPDFEGDGGKTMYAFCTRCAMDPESARCRVCGCTDAFACDEPCSWVAPNLCSGCVS